MSTSASLPRSSSHARRDAASPLPISIVNRSRVPAGSTSPNDTFSILRVSGFIVVSQSCSAFISPSPLKREIVQLPSRTPSLRSLSSTCLSSPSSRQ